MLTLTLWQGQLYCKLQRHNTENYKQIFSEKELRGHSKKILLVGPLQLLCLKAEDSS
jgi:hypothetical protein